jgi:hypothetical protein
MGGFEPTTDARSFRSGAGEIVLWFPLEGVAAARVSGNIREAIAVATYAEIDRYALAHLHPGRGFVDLTEMTAFDWEAKAVMVRWNIAHRRRASRFDILSGSRIAHGAIKALGGVLGERLVSHADAATFEAAYTALLRSRSERPPPRVKSDYPRGW